MKKCMIFFLMCVASAVHALTVHNKTDGGITLRGFDEKGRSLCTVIISQEQNKDIGACKPAELSSLMIDTAEGVAIGAIRQPKFNMIKTIVVKGADGKYTYTKDGVGPYKL